MIRPRMRDLPAWFEKSGPPLAALSTHWSRVLAARSPSEEGKEALRRLAERYYGAVFRTLRASGLSHDDAEEMTQRFFAVFCAGKYVGLADPSKGSFRGFLKTCVRNFASDEREKERRRRGTPIERLAEPEGRESTEEVLDREIAWQLLAEAKEAARKRLCDQPEAWEALRRFDLEPGPPEQRTHDIVARGMGIDVPRFRRALYRARQVFKEEVCRSLREGLGAESEIDAEVEWFLGAIAKGPPRDATPESPSR